jgi:phosphoglycerol transferase MdoB-like AlkP superfamily enzyme
MKKRFSALGLYILFWLSFFILARVFFILVQHNDAFKNSPGELFGTFMHGMALDISTTGYYLMLPMLVAVAGIFLTGNWYRIFIRLYTYLLIVFSSLIVVADANLYSYWGFRMDYTPMLYLKTPGEAIASVSTLMELTFFLTVILLSLLFVYVYRKLIDNKFRDLGIVRHPLADSVLFLLLTGSLIIPIRGGFGVAPINAGSVYFSKKMFLNHTAINAVWNVGTSAFTQKPVKNPYNYGDQADARTLVDSLTVKRGIPQKFLSVEKPNVLVIVLESFSGFLIGPLGGDSLVTPNFNRYAKEGILFSNFYASGTRTDKAMPAILNGYPAQPAQSIIKEPKKTQSLQSLVKIFNGHGYQSAFWYGGDINFANFKSFVIGSGFDKIVTEDNFRPEDYNSKWGVHDHIMFKTFEDSMKVVSEPFFDVVLTLSSHEPFDVPMEPVFTGNDNMTKYKNSVYYADKALGSFLDWAKTTEWWQNTLIIMVADHCCRISTDVPNGSRGIFRIPMVWTGGALNVSGLKIEKTGGQVDIANTLLNQVGFEGSFPFGKDLLSKDSKSFAFYTYNEGFGFITDSSAVQYDQKVKKVVVSDGKDPGFAETNGKAYLQVLFDDYLKR